MDLDRLEPLGSAGWTGSLIQGKRDASGLIYMRNRYYDPKTGRFTGVLTPAVDATTGEPFPTVLFRLIEGAIVSDPDVTQLAVDGQLMGRAMNLVVREVLGPDMHIFAMGTTLTTPGDQDGSSFERAAGVGVGPELGPFEDHALWQVVRATASPPGVEPGGRTLPGLLLVPPVLVVSLDRRARRSRKHRRARQSARHVLTAKEPPLRVLA